MRSLNCWIRYRRGWITSIKVPREGSIGTQPKRWVQISRKRIKISKAHLLAFRVPRRVFRHHRLRYKTRSKKACQQLETQWSQQQTFRKDAIWQRRKQLFNPCICHNRVTIRIRVLIKGVSTPISFQRTPLAQDWSKESQYSTTNKHPPLHLEIDQRNQQRQPKRPRELRKFRHFREMSGFQGCKPRSAPGSCTVSRLDRGCWRV